MTPKQKLRVDVMISSTSIDLPKHRDAASRAISLLSLNPRGMEHLPASGRDAIEASYKLVDEAEVYVGIFGFRYGFVPPDKERNPDQKSITELEYRRARERGIPVFCFFMDKAHAGPETAEEGENFYEQTEAGREKLKALKNEIGLEMGVKWFKNPDELQHQIYHALDLAIKEGLIKTEGDAPPPAPDSVLLPAPPAPYEPHPYRLTQTFFGRVSDLATLDTWAASADAVMVVEAIGGVGKSALTYEWFTRHHADFDGALWWSFYESESSMRRFVRHALAYLTRQPIDHYKNERDADLETKLLALLNQKRVLIVFDGLERAMAAYHRLDAAQTLDDAAENPDKAADSALTDQREADLLRKLAAVTRSKLLISTRLNPSDLQDKGGGWLKGVRGLHLNGLSDPDALALIRHYGVKGDSERIGAFMRRFGNHSLLIKIVAGLVNDYRPAPSDFDRWWAEVGQDLTVSELDLKQNRTNILAAAMRGLKPELAKLLSQIAAFRFPVDYAAVSAFNPYLPLAPAKVEEPDDWLLWSDVEEAEAKAPYQVYMKEYDDFLKSPSYREGLRKFHTALRELEERGLVAWDREANTYDLHPVVRATAFEALTDDSRAETFNRIRSHFENLPPEKLDEVTEVHQLTRSIEIYTALVRAGQLDAASDFYQDRLSDILEYQLAAYYTIVELLRPLFHDDLSQPPRLSTPVRQSAQMTNLASAFYHLGQTVPALMLQEATLKLNLDQQDPANLAIGLLNYGNALRSLNQCQRAGAVWGLSLALAEAAGNLDGIVMGHLHLHLAANESGVLVEAFTHYQIFIANLPRNQTSFWAGTIERQQTELLLAFGMVEQAKAALERAWDLAVKSHDALGQMVIWGLRGELALAQGESNQAVQCFSESVRLRRAVGTSDVVVALGGLARALLAVDKPDEARKIIEENLQENKLGEAIDAAEVWFDLRELDKAQERALEAYKWAWADGPPYIHWRYLERAKKVLDALGEPYPDLPLFDPSKVEPIPHEAEILTFIKKYKKDLKRKDSQYRSVVAPGHPYPKVQLKRRKP
ncbi:MAG: DUF4062 domain-containing protein [Anaerolineae bacterium]|jgi:tetratricopeptide (TPR) repeat protein|nr:DUF4062 domain-containing protein [Anaerolineae bacterium]